MKPKKTMIAALILACASFAACADRNTASEKKEARNSAKLLKALDALGTEDAAEISEYIRQNAGKVNEEISQQFDATPLMLAAKKNAADITQLLIKAGADVNKKKDLGETALIYTAHNNAADAARVLIKAGADLNVTGRYCDTPLIEAVEYNALDMVRLLIEVGADVNAIHPGNKETALMKAACASEESTRLLIAAGADVNAKTSQGKTALTLAFEGEAYEIFENPTPVKDEVIDVLKAAGAQKGD